MKGKSEMLGKSARINY